MKCRKQEVYKNVRLVVNLIRSWPLESSLAATVYFILVKLLLLLQSNANKYCHFIILEYNKYNLFSFFN